MNHADQNNPDQAEQDRAIEDLARRVLDHGVENLDGATRSRLNRIRHLALDEADHQSAGRWWPAGLAASGAVLILAVGVGMRSAAPPAPDSPGAVPGLAGVTRADGPLESNTALEDLALLSSAEFELVEDLEFYLWLEDALEPG